MTAKTNAERQADWRQRNLDAGFKLVNVWCHPDDAERLKRYAERLRRQRLKEDHKP